MTRKLVHIERVTSVTPIENADRIELAKVLGWQCVVKKGDIQPGELAVYFEIDSFLPIDPRFEFLRQTSFTRMGDEEGFRLRTMKLRKVLSQGLLLSTSTFPELAGMVIGEGTDLTVHLKVKLFELPIPADLHGKVKGTFPSFIKKTDQERIQNLPEYFTKHRVMRFEVTEKIDGTSATYYWKDGVFSACSRNLELLDDGMNMIWQVANDLHLPETLASIKRNIAIQGEGAGEGINNNPLSIKGHKLFVFDMWDIDTHRHLMPAERIVLFTRIKESSPGIEHVPIIDPSMPVFERLESIERLLAFAHGPSLVNPKRSREGMVFKSNVLDDDDTVSFKVIDNELLLKETS